MSRPLPSPPLYYGKSNEHWHFPGTVTLSATTLLQTLVEMAESLYRAGFRKLVLVNGHGGQPQVLEIAARDVHQVHSDMMVFPLFVWNVPNIAADLLTEKELALGGGEGKGRDIVTQLFQRPTDYGCGDCAIHCQWQVRPVLLDRSDRLDNDNILLVRHVPNIGPG